MGEGRRSYQDWVEDIKKYSIEKGKYILVPAVNGRKQKKRTGYAKILDMVSKQSGEIEILVQQGNKRLLFTLDELERFWSRCSDLQPRVTEGR